MPCKICQTSARTKQSFHNLIIIFILLNFEIIYLPLASSRHHATASSLRPLTSNEPPHNAPCNVISLDRQQGSPHVSQILPTRRSHQLPLLHIRQRRLQEGRIQPLRRPSHDNRQLFLLAMETPNLRHSLPLHNLPSPLSISPPLTRRDTTPSPPLRSRAHPRRAGRVLRPTHPRELGHRCTRLFQEFVSMCSSPLQFED